MAEGAIRYFFVERLRLATWLTAVWPRIRRMAAPGATVWYVEGDGAALALARRMAARRGLSLARWTFDASRMHDAEGTLVWMRTHYGEMLEALDHVARQPALARFLADGGQPPEAKTWVMKLLLPGDANAAGPGLWRAMYLVLVALWQARRDGVPHGQAMLFPRRWPLVGGLASYARGHGLGGFVPVGRETRSGGALRRVLARDLLFLRDGLSRGGRSAQPRADGPLLGVQYYGQFNLDRPELYSDFFFWQQSDFPAGRLLGLFDLPGDPLDGRRMAELASRGLAGVATRHRAARDGAPVAVLPSPARSLAAAGRVLADACRPLDSGWINAERTAFASQKRHWTRFFGRLGIRVYTTWYKYNADHCAIAAALRELDGVLAIYQRSYEGDPTAKTRLETDIYFGFAPGGAAVEAAAGSRIGHFVAVGYVGDHRFALARPEADRLRDALRRRGARHIAAYFDEGSCVDGRWGTDVGRLREHYGFLLEAMLRDDEMGLILKPKVPKTLRSRLGPVAPLLERALATGRCHLYDEGFHHGAVIPAQAALAADLAIHGSLASGTAGCEAALAGVPTVLVDDDGWKSGPLGRLPRGQVVFDDWGALWHTWRESRVRPGAFPGFANWSPILEELDPFRDGQAARRMGTYLKWLIEGLAAGQSRDRVLAEAADRHREAWGEDKVATVRPVPRWAAGA